MLSTKTKKTLINSAALLTTLVVLPAQASQWTEVSCELKAAGSSRTSAFAFDFSVQDGAGQGQLEIPAGELGPEALQVHALVSRITRTEQFEIEEVLSVRNSRNETIASLRQRNFVAKDLELLNASAKSLNTTLNFNTGSVRNPELAEVSLDCKLLAPRS